MSKHLIMTHLRVVVRPKAEDRVQVDDHVSPHQKGFLSVSLRTSGDGRTIADGPLTNMTDSPLPRASQLVPDLFQPGLVRWHLPIPPFRTFDQSKQARKGAPPRPLDMQRLPQAQGLKHAGPSLQLWQGRCQGLLPMHERMPWFQAASH